MSRLFKISESLSLYASQIVEHERLNQQSKWESKILEVAVESKWELGTENLIKVP